MNNPQISVLTGEFIDAPIEREYRYSRRHKDRLHLRIIWCLSILFFGLFAVADNTLFSEPDAVHALNSLRFAIVLVGATVLATSFTLRFESATDAMTLFAFLAVSLFYAVLSGVRGESAGNLAGVLLLVIGFYVFSPNRFWFNVCGAIFCTVAYITVTEALVSPAHSWLAGYGYLIPANLLAMLCLVRMNRLHRQQYLNNQMLQQENVARAEAERALKRSHDDNRRLLINVLPQSIVSEMQGGGRELTARQYENATILFADIVNFTALARALEPRQLIELLNLVFTRFDQLADQHGMEKIKTLGDAYMAVAGVPHERVDHHWAAAAMALDLHRVAEELSMQIGRDLQLRLGVNSGPLVAGIIGSRRFAYDVWGDSVNLASRLQHHATPGQTLYTQACADTLRDRYIFEEVGNLRVKGQGVVATCALLGSMDYRPSVEMMSSTTASIGLS